MNNDELQVINVIDSKIEELKAQKEKCDNAATYPQIKRLFTIAAPVMAFAGAAICIWLSGNSPLTYNLSTSLGEINGVLGLGSLFSLITIPTAVSVVKYEKKNCENTEREKEAITNEINALSNQKQKILNNMRTNNKENENDRNKPSIGRDEYRNVYTNRGENEKTPTLVKTR